jgi:hypothetical protein
MRTQVHSPYRGDHITSFLKHIPISFQKKITENVFNVAPAALLFVGTIWWGDSTFDAESKKHRS